MKLLHRSGAVRSALELMRAASRANPVAANAGWVAPEDDSRDPVRHWRTNRDGGPREPPDKEPRQKAFDKTAQGFREDTRKLKSGLSAKGNKRIPTKPPADKPPEDTDIFYGETRSAAEPAQSAERREQSDERKTRSELKRLKLAKNVDAALKAVQKIGRARNADLMERVSDVKARLEEQKCHERQAAAEQLLSCMKGRFLPNGWKLEETCLYWHVAGPSRTVGKIENRSAYLKPLYDVLENSLEKSLPSWAKFTHDRAYRIEKREEMERNRTLTPVTIEADGRTVNKQVRRVSVLPIWDDDGQVVEAAEESMDFWEKDFLPSRSSDNESEDAHQLRPSATARQDKKPRLKVAAFDFDDCISDPCVRLRFKRLVKELQGDGYEVVIFSNQNIMSGGLERKVAKTARQIQKMEENDERLQEKQLEGGIHTEIALQKLGRKVERTVLDFERFLGGIVGVKEMMGLMKEVRAAEGRRDSRNLALESGEDSLLEKRDNLQNMVTPSLREESSLLAMDSVSRPIHVYLAVGRGNAKDRYRKPETSMWDLFVRRFPEGFEIDYANSFFVGNNAGRKNDKTNSDLIFAERTGLRFFTEEFIYAFDR